MVHIYYLSFLASVLPGTYAVTVADYARLNNTVSGRLFRGFPLAKPCYSLYENGTNTPNLSACAKVQAGYQTDQYIVTQYGGFMNTNWATCQATAQGCPLDYLLPSNPLVYAPPNVCHQGSLSPYYIDVRTPQDVQAGLAFAQANNISISIKNSGHDYKGRNSAPGSLALWTHNVQPAIVMTKGFVPDGCSSPVGDAVTFGAGQGFLGLYEFAEANNISIVGGSSPTVGTAGGWITGGGHSAISNTLGLGVDNVMQLRAVLPNGTYVTANECQNQDIFFALRGGGGSTFGVIMEMTTRANPQLQLQVVYIRFASLDPQALKKFLQVCVDSALTWADGGWGGYIEPGAISTQGSGLVLMTPKISLAEAKAQMKNITDLASSFGSLALNNEVATANSYYEAYQKYLVPNEEKNGLGTAVGSRLIPRDNFADPSSKVTLVDTLYNISKLVTYPFKQPLNPLLLGYGAPLQFLVTAPNNYNVTTDTSAITPAWRKAVWHIFVNNVFTNTASAKQIQNAFQTSHQATQMLQAIAPDSGAYINEGDTFQDDHENTYWGAENYERLLKIKSAVDPNNILTCHQCVGWNASDSRYGCYPSVV